MKKKFIVVLVVVFTFSHFSFVQSATSNSIVINEIGATEATGFEWVEIYNRGSADIDVTGYKFWEGATNHSVVVKQGSAILKKGEFALIVQDDVKFKQKYPSVTSTILDSSWGTLNESGEEIGLKDAGGNFLEQFVYVATTKFSLERVDAQSEVYTGENWKEHVSGNTAGGVNSWMVVPTPVVIPPPVVETPAPTPEPTVSSTPVSPPPVIFEPIPQESANNQAPSSTQEQSPPQQTGTESNPTTSQEPIKIVINEFLPQPNDGEKEWIELYNNSSIRVDLNGWSIEDGTGKITAPSSTVAAHEFFVIELASSKLNNDGDAIIVKNAAGEIVDEVYYGDGEERSEPAPPKKGNTMARLVDGGDTNNDREDFRETTTPTKGTFNSIVLPQAPLIPTETHTSPSVSSGNVTTPTNTQIQSIPAGAVVINEVCPNPTGADSEDEFIELLNTTNNSIDLTGYKLMDASATSFSLIQTIVGNGFVTVYRKVTHISLNNTGTEVVKVVGPNTEVVAEFTYEGSHEGESINRTENGEIKWSTMTTPNAKNNIQEKIILDDASTSSAQVEDGGAKKNKTLKAAPKIEFNEEIGNYLQLSEIFPAPEKGAEEFIEIFNSASTTLDISFFQVDDEEGGSRPYVFPEGTKIESQQFFVITKKVSHLSLNNTEDSARILFPNGEIVEEVRYDEVEGGSSYARDPSTSSGQDGEWEWTSEVTPGTENKIIVVETTTKAKKTGALIVTTLDKIAELEKGDRVQVQGTVVVLPNTLSSQYLYIAGTAGVQVYMSKRNFPPLLLGDRIQVTGELSETQGQLRIKIKEKTDMVKIGREEITVQEVGIAEIEESLQGMVVAISGEITEKKSTYLYIDDGTAELEVSLKKNAGIKTQDMKLGDSISVTGIVLAGKSGYQIVPRSASDVVKKTSSSTPFVAAPEKSETKKEKTLFVATTGGVGSLLLGFLAKVHGSKVLNFSKRIGGAAVAVIRRKKDLG